MAVVSGGGGDVAPALPTGSAPVGVRMLVSVSGTRDGVEWPPAGSVVVLPAAEAGDMILSGLAVAVDDGGRESAVLEPDESAVAPSPRKRSTKRGDG